MQPIISNTTTSNEPLRNNVRASRNKKPLDKDEDFLWY